jgi:aldehyde dehydrogenase (NAD+)
MLTESPIANLTLKASNRLFIDGHWIEPSTNEPLVLISPDSGKVFGTTAQAGVAEVDSAVAAARRAFDQGPWPHMAMSDRVAIMHRLVDRLEARTSELCTAWNAQVGALVSIAPTVISAANSIARRIVEEAKAFPSIVRVATTEAETALIAQEPVGVVAAIAPWNFPYDIMISKVVSALVTGCTVVMKPAPETPLEAYIIAEAAEAAGVPHGVINLVPANRDASDHLVQHPAIDLVSFTGSTLTGQRIANVCGNRIARYILELGGKSAAIVRDDYDIDAAAKLLASTIIVMSGQVCAMLSRVIVSQHRHDALAFAISRQLSDVRVGISTDPATQMGPLAMQRQLERVESYIARGVKQGADLVTGGRRPAHLKEGYFIEPTLFANVDSKGDISQDEIFGPVLSLIPCKDDDDAVRIANDSRYGLFGSVLTNDVNAAYRIGRAVRSGTFAQNGLRSDFALPYGGKKQSGVGREGGMAGLLAYTESKTILLDVMPDSLEA